MSIPIFSSRGDPRRQASLYEEGVHGLTPQQVQQMDTRARGFQLGDISSNYTGTPGILRDVMPDGISLSPMRRRADSPIGMANPMAGGNSVFTSSRGYLPEVDSIDRQSYPIYRILANKYWRLFYKLDPVIGAVIDLMGDLPFGDFQLAGEGVDGEIKQRLDDMNDRVKLRSLLPSMAREFDVVGEVCPHAFYSNDMGAWDAITLHNPDYLEVVYSPFLRMDPIVEFVPDQKLRAIVNATHPMLVRYRESMPAELVSKLRSGENIPLDPVNCTFIPRRLHPYDIRGTSIISRLWRTLMAEDALWNSLIQTARRASAPIKIIKLGDPATGTIPSPEEEKRVLGLFAQAENDPQAWISYSYQIATEMGGAPERVMSIRDNYDLIERLKLTALGVSKALLSGEASYSAAAAGLTIFLQRMKARRQFFESEWILPKYFLPVAMANRWVKPTQAELSHGVRTKRSWVELQDAGRFIVPNIEWAKSLDPQIERERIDAMVALEQQLKVKISDQKKYAAMGLNNEEEQKQIVREMEFKKHLAGNDPMLQAAIGLAAPTTEDGGMGMLSPGIPPAMPGGDEMADMGGDMSAPMPAAPTGPEGASLAADQGALPGPAEVPTPEHITSMVGGAQKLFTFDLGDLDEPWVYAAKSPQIQEAVRLQDKGLLWEAVADWMSLEGYPREDIEGLQKALTAQSVLPRVAHSDSEFDALFTQLTGLAPDSDDVNFLNGAR